MKNFARYGTVMLVGLLTMGCAFLGGTEPTKPTVAYKPTVPYNPDDAAYIHERGQSVVEGQAFARTRGGIVQTCAGLRVNLYPVTEYTWERFRHIFSVAAAGEPNHPTAAVSEERFRRGKYGNLEHDPRFYQDNRDTVCGTDGGFRFAGVPVGEYFVVARVVWGEGVRYLGKQGGVLMKRIQVTTEDEIITVILSWA